MGPSRRNIRLAHSFPSCADLPSLASLTQGMLPAPSPFHHLVPPSLPASSPTSWRIGKNKDLQHASGGEPAGCDRYRPVGMVPEVPGMEVPEGPTSRAGGGGVKSFPGLRLDG